MGRPKLKMAAVPAGRPTISYLAREVVRADWVLSGAEVGLMPDLAKWWADYAENLRDWRFALMRGWSLYYVHVCPCGRLVYVEHNARCFACGAWYTRGRPRLGRTVR